ncbi:MAG: metallophosphoesterase [Planctomycetota bacterium]
MRKKTTLTAVALCAQVVILTLFAAGVRGGERGPAYSFVYLGDLHFDKMSHHDFEWVKADKPNDIRQIDEYVASTEKYAPGLLKRIHSSIESSEGRIKMVVQGGDLTEGLCGSRELQETQFRDVRAFIRSCIPDTMFVATKGNHDITGPGAREAFDNIMLPWLSTECGKQIDSASFFLMQGLDLFVFFDAYHNNSLDWLDKTLRENKHRHVFIVMHPPAVPYNARSTWHLFWREREREVRERFLSILGVNRAILLTAHLHKYSVVTRKTSSGAFVQFSMNSVISSPNSSVKDYREGVEHYGGALVELEPEFQPETEAQRRKMLEDEKPYITSFEFADFPGYAVINASDAGVTADIYVADSDKAWKSVSMMPVLSNAK